MKAGVAPVARLMASIDEINVLRMVVVVRL